MIRRTLSFIILCLLVPFSLTTSCSSTDASGPTKSPGPAPCYLLEVSLYNAQGTPMSIPKNGVSCKHGYFMGKTPLSDINFVRAQQSNVYGPDCTFTFNANEKTYRIRAQQNYCFLEAGDVTARVVSGDAQITGTENGSVSNDRPGRVKVRLN